MLGADRQVYEGTARVNEDLYDSIANAGGLDETRLVVGARDGALWNLATHKMISDPSGGRTFRGLRAFHQIAMLQFDDGATFGIELKSE